MDAHSNCSLTWTLRVSPQADKAAFVRVGSGSIATIILSFGHFGTSFKSEGICVGVAKMTVSSAWLMLVKRGMSTKEITEMLYKLAHMNSTGTGISRKSQQLLL